ncbi:MAG: penicillin-binding transpeptidase domain-containing protein [Bacillota bacterium]|nr:penicillin-binding transpeptidase domain-containing protein [Bacillota bacterium]
MDDLSTSIKKVLIVFLILFVSLISYFCYFTVFDGPATAARVQNNRLWAKRNEVLRGTIYDRNGSALTKSEKVNTLTQKTQYLGGAAFAHVLGYVDPKYGLTGLEATYDADLMADNSSSFLELLKNKGQTKEKIGHSLKTTLDSDLQKTAYDLLGDRRGSVVALNPNTGEILAMVSTPSYNPNNLSADWQSINSNPDKPLINRAVAGLYPPGSVFKVVTLTSTLENLKGIQDRTFEDNGKIVFNSKYSLSNYGGHAYGNIDLRTGFLKSSNVVFGTLAMELGNKNLKSTAEKYFFNKDIEADGVVINNSRFPEIPSSEPGNIAQSGIGQSSILASPIEMALVASTIANKGIMMRPKLVSEVMTYDKQSIRIVPDQQLGRVTSEDVAGIIKDYMRDVVVSGTGKSAAVSGIQVCGKTGTADHDNGDKEPHSWFIGFAPYDNPQVAVAVIVEEGGTGGGAAAKIASGVFQKALIK